MIDAWSEAPDFLDRAPNLPNLPIDVETVGGATPSATSPLDFRHLLEGWSSYSLEECLGTGGTSVVYRATDRRSGRPVAIKFLIHLGEGQLARFRREAAALSRVRHPNVLELYESGTVEGIPFLATRLIDGTDLRGIRPETSVTERVELIRQTALGLQAAHDQGVIHRDVKPSNILVERTSTDDLISYLADFGIARDDSDSQRITRTGMLVGTPCYLAPERLRGKPGSLDQRSDVYALGVTFYELLTGHRPYSSSTTLEMLLEIRDGQITLPRDVMPGLPTELEAIVMKCLAIEPQDRYPSASALVDEIDRFLAGQRIQAQPPPRHSGVFPGASPRRRLPIVALSTVIVIAAITWVLTRGFVEPPGLPADHNSQAAHLREPTPAMPRHQEAARLYSQGLASLRQLDFLKARVFLEMAVASEPEHPLPHAALSEAWRQLGHDRTAQSEAERALDLASTLHDDARLEVEAQLRITRNEWPRAVEIYRQLWASSPDHRDYGVRLAEIEIETGLAGRALETIDQLRQLESNIGPDPRVDLLESKAAEAASNPSRARAAAERTVQLAREQNATLLLARGQLQKAKTLIRSDEMDTGLETAEEAKQAFARAGDPSGMADALMVTGTALQSRGELSQALARGQEAAGIYREIGDRRGTALALNQIAIASYRLDGDRKMARQRFEDVLDLYREIGDRRGIATSHNNIALILYGGGAYQEAADLYQQAADLQREIGDREGLARSLGNLALAFQALQDLEAATRSQQQSLTIKTEIPDPSGIAVSHLNLGHLYRLQAETETALRHYQEALERSQALNWRPGQARALNGLGRLSFLHGDLGEARRRQQQAIALQAEIGGVFSLGQMDLARVLLAEGQLAKAETAARAAAAERRIGASARAILARVLWRQGKTTAARSEWRQVPPPAPESRGAADLGLRLDLARLQAVLAPEEIGEARVTIEQVLADAGAAGFRIVAFEAELALAEIDAASGAFADEDRRRVEELIGRTQDRGLKLFTKRAQKLLRTPP